MGKLTKEEVIERIRKIHGDKYGGVDDINYVNVHTKIELVCPVHGKFEITPKSIFKGCGCRLCSQAKNSGKNKLDAKTIIEKCKEIHNGKYIYTEETIEQYEGLNSKVPIICPSHGIFYQSFLNHMYRKCGCPKCQRKYNSVQEVIEDAIKMHGDKYDYSLVKEYKTGSKVPIVCHEKDCNGNEHGIFYQYVYCHINRGYGCPNCAKENKENRRTIPEEEFIKRIKNIHGDKYDYSDLRYNKMSDYVYPICHVKNNSGIEHGVFKITGNNFCNYGCPKCARHNFSSAEKEIVSFLLENNIPCEENCRNIIDGIELDIYVPSNNTAIEYDGLFWHSETKCRGNAKTYHLEKTNKCEKAGIRLIHIFEDEWACKQEIVKSRLKSILGITSAKIYARQCEIKEVPPPETRIFLEENHLQGNLPSKYRYGLYFNGELVSLMAFGCLRKNLNGKNEEGSFELLRFCNKLGTSIVGGASKLLGHFIKEVKPNKIISYADKCWSNGDLYYKLGFTHTHDSRPNYFYVVGKRRENRFKYRKSVLVEKFGCNKGMSEHEFCLAQKWYRIYDCGCMVFQKEF